MMDYVDKGDLRIEMRDLAVFGEESERAARAAYAAGLQGKYLGIPQCHVRRWRASP